MKKLRTLVAATLMISVFTVGAVFAQAMTGLVNINTADEAALIALEHIGKAKAQAIVKYRHEHGAFKTVDELKGVPGIGDRVLTAIRDKVTVGDAQK